MFGTPPLNMTDFLIVTVEYVKTRIASEKIMSPVRGYTIGIRADPHFMRAIAIMDYNTEILAVVSVYRMNPSIITVFSIIYNAIVEGRKS